MPLFYFQVQEAGLNVGTEEGPLELPNIEEAWKEGIRTCGELLQMYENRFNLGSQLSLLVQDEYRQTLRSIVVQGF